jgi:hypothetical protein
LLSLKRGRAGGNFSIALVLVGFMLLFSSAFAGTINPAQTEKGIPVPLLLNHVTLDARKTTPDEWSDASETQLFMNCWTNPSGGGCVNAPKEIQRRTNMTVWLKHDGTWLYFLYEIYWTGALPQDDVGSVCYYWGNDTSLPWQYADCGGIGPALGYPTPFDSWMEKRSGKNYWLDEKSANINVEGWARYDGKNFWYEFRKLLNSGNEHDWNFTVGRAYPEGANWSFEFGFQYGYSNEGYYASVKINLLPLALVSMTETSTSQTIQQTTASSTSSTTSSVEVLLTQSSSAPAGMPLNSIVLTGAIAAVAVVSSVLILIRRRKGDAQMTVLEQKTEAGPSSVKETALREGVLRQAVSKREPVAETALPKEVFVSYSSEDMQVAMQICGLLEERGIGCWITPRDVTPGKSYAEEIINAIESTSATVLVLSEHANLSVHVRNEIERAVSKGKTIFPIRIREVQPSKALELFISSAQWIDAFKPPIEAQISTLAAAIRLLKTEGKWRP